MCISLDRSCQSSNKLHLLSIFRRECFPKQASTPKGWTKVILFKSNPCCHPTELESAGIRRFLRNWQKLSGNLTRSCQKLSRNLTETYQKTASNQQEDCFKLARKLLLIQRLYIGDGQDFSFNNLLPPPWLQIIWLYLSILDPTTKNATKARQPGARSQPC